LFPKSCEKTILDLIFLLATWHALAKLCMHSTSSHSFFEGVTKALGQLLRRFNDHVCSNYDTVETPAEYAKKARHKAAKAAKSKDCDSVPNTDAKSQRSSRVFNLATYKIHALGHYPLWIRYFGTTDSYSTQAVRRFLTFLVDII
jgi:hypothetical protein